MIILIINLLILIYSIIIHEISHGFIANLLGDPTAKNQGRLTLNPMPHIDILGSILLPGLLFVTHSPFLIGWAKPVPINPRYFRDENKGSMLVSLAGPAANLIVAFIAIIIIKICFLSTAVNNSVMISLITILSVVIQINLLLAIFNLIPIPPLDGSRILYYFLPPKAQIFMDQIEPYGFLIIFALAYLGILAPILFFFLKPFSWLL